MSELQTLVDALAEEIGQPVGVDDRHFRAVAYSSHPDQIDRVRIASILHREAPPGVIEWLESLGVAVSDQPVRVPANERFEMASRVCVPLRFNGTMLGYLWLIDEPQPLTEAQLDQSVDYAKALAVSLYRQRHLDNEEREREIVGRLLTPGFAGEPGPTLEDPFVRAPVYGVAILRALHPGGEAVPEAVGALLAEAADRVRRAMSPGHLLVDTGAEQLRCVFACGGSDELLRRFEDLRTAAMHELASQPGWTPLVGAGDPVDDLLSLPVAGRHAREALLVGEAIGSPAAVVLWGDLGSYRTIAALLGTREAAGFLPAGVRALRDSDDSGTLIETLERYLDKGGDARGAADELFLHRSSLYGRLRKIEQITGADLHSGEERLELHLGIRLLRLGGWAPGAADPAGADR